MAQNTQKYFIHPYNKEILNNYLVSKNLPDYRVFDDNHIQKIKNLQTNYYTLLLNSIIKKNEKTSTFSSPDLIGSFNNSTDITHLITTNGKRKSMFMYNNNRKPIEIGVINNGIFGNNSLSSLQNDEAIDLTREYIKKFIDIKSVKSPKVLYQLLKRKNPSSPLNKSTSPPHNTNKKNKHRNNSPPSLSLGNSASNKLDTKLFFKQKTPPSSDGSTRSTKTYSTLPKNTSHQSISSLLSPSISPDIGTRTNVNPLSAASILLHSARTPSPKNSNTYYRTPSPSNNRTPSPSNNRKSKLTQPKTPPKAPHKKKKGGTLKKSKNNKK